MKKQLTKHVLIGMGLAVLSTNAFATKARMEALGQSNVQGSLYIKDTLNVFRNAAHVNTFKNYVVTEWGTAGAAAQNAEGGFFREQGSFNYGVYLGSQVGRGLTESITTLANYLEETNRVQAFIGGDMGVQWGASLYYDSAKDDSPPNKRKQNAMGVQLGAIAGAIEGYVNLQVANKLKGSTDDAKDELKGKLGMQIGASYNFNNWTAFLDYSKRSNEEKKAGTKTAGKYEQTNITVGAGHIHEVTSTARIFTDISYRNGKTKNFAAAEVKTSALPLTVGFEADATSWLTLRGSVSQNFVLGETKNDGVKTTMANSTTVAGGATLTFGKLMVDGMIGTTGHARNAPTAADEGVLALDNLMTKVAVHYWF